MLSRSMVRLMTALVLMALGPVAFGRPPDARAAGIKKGAYKGSATTTTECLGFKLATRGTILLTLQEMDPQGRFNVKVQFTNGLTGSGRITGKIDGNGRLRGRGEFDTGLKELEAGLGLEYRLSLNARAEKGGRLVGTYTISSYMSLFGGRQLLAVQDGQFSSTFMEGDVDDGAEDDRP